jgi:formylglycine-generating enzyme required for sulfatase activity
MLKLVSDPCQVQAQARARLTLDRVNGLTVTGSSNTLYTVQTTTNLGPNAVWTSINFLKMQTTSQVIPGTAPAATGSKFYRAISVSSTPTNFVYIPAGTFLMGSSNTEVGRFSDEGPVTTVTLSSGIWMTTNMVTQAEYSSITGTNPSSFVDMSRPVDQVTWFQATNYCDLLTKAQLAGGLIPPGTAYRLPTEAEFEYAARAGTTTRFYYGDDPGYLNLTNQAWYLDNSDSQSQPVGQMPPNPWGLRDMEGNMWEWCMDWYDYYSGSKVTDPAGPSDGTLRVLRGGSWLDENRFCRSACRVGDDPSAIYNNYSFRVVLAPAGH